MPMGFISCLFPEVSWAGAVSWGRVSAGILFVGGAVRHSMCLLGFWLAQHTAHLGRVQSQLLRELGTESLQ